MKKVWHQNKCLFSIQIEGDLFCPVEYNTIDKVAFDKTLCFLDNEKNQPLLKGMRRQLVGDKKSKLKFNYE